MRFALLLSLHLALLGMQMSGHLIIETDDMDYLWDGKLADGRLAPVGVYAYYIVYQTSDDDLKELTGQFSLVR